MADENDDLKGSGKSDGDDNKNNAGKKSDGDGKGNAGKSSKQDKSKKGDSDADDLDDDEKPKFSQSQVNRMLNKQKDKLTKEKDLSDLEKAQNEANEAKAELAKMQQKTKFQSALGINESQANRLFNAYSDDLEFDDKNNVTNLKEIKEMAKKDFPELFKAKAKGDIDAGDDGDKKKDTGGSMNDLIRRKAGRG